MPVWWVRSMAKFAWLVALRICVGRLTTLGVTPAAMAYCARADHALQAWCVFFVAVQGYGSFAQLPLPRWHFFTCHVSVVLTLLRRSLRFAWLHRLCVLT